MLPHPSRHLQKLSAVTEPRTAFQSSWRHFTWRGSGNDCRCCLNMNIPENLLRRGVIKLKKLALLTSAVGLEGNHAVLNYLEKQGWSELSVDLIIKSFSDLEVPLISSAKVERLSKQAYNTQGVRLAAAERADIVLITSMCAFDCYLELRSIPNPDEMRSQHGRIIRFFL